MLTCKVYSLDFYQSQFALPGALIVTQYKKGSHLSQGNDRLSLFIKLTFFLFPVRNCYAFILTGFTLVKLGFYGIVAKMESRFTYVPLFPGNSIFPNIKKPLMNCFPISGSKNALPFRSVPLRPRMNDVKTILLSVVGFFMIVKITPCRDS